MIATSHPGHFPWVLRARKGDGKAVITWWGCLDCFEKELEVNSPHVEFCDRLVRSDVGRGTESACMACAGHLRVRGGKYSPLFGSQVTRVGPD